MDYRKRMATLRFRQAEAQELQAFVRREVDELEREFKALVPKRWTEAFPGFELDAGLFAHEFMILMQGGSAAEGWDPHVVFLRLGLNVYTAEGWFKVPDITKTWGPFYRHNLTKVEPPVPQQALEEFFTRFQEDTGIPVRLEVHKIEDAPEHVRDFDGLKAMFGTDIVEEFSGRVWYTGWDIPDPYVVFRTPDGKLRVSHGEGAHGSALCTHVEPGDHEALDEFFKMCEEGDSAHLRKRWEREILDSWEVKADSKPAKA